MKAREWYVAAGIAVFALIVVGSPRERIDALL